MKYIFTFIFIFLFMSSAQAVKLKLNESYIGTIKDNYGNIVLLPPGNFVVKEIRKDSAYYYQVDFYNSKDDIWVIFSGVTQSQGHVSGWRGGLESDCDSKNTLTKDVRKKGNASIDEWCFYSEDGWTVNLNRHVSNKGFYWTVYYFNPNNIDNGIKNQGHNIFNEYKKAALKRNKSASLNFLYDFYGAQSLSSSDAASDTNTDNNNFRFCQDGDGIVSKKTGAFCDALMGEYEIPKKQYCYVARHDTQTCGEDSSEAKNTSSVKEKLKELKSMLDEGLISQEQYEDKSSKILDQF